MVLMNLTQVGRCEDSADLECVRGFGHLWRSHKSRKAGLLI